MTAKFEAVILAAGMGTRLGRPHPKPLTKLDTGETIMRRQITNLRKVFGDDLRITAVVGYKLDWVIENNPDLGFVYNPYFDTTNTSKSLLKALQHTGPHGIMWLNGDVVFDHELLGLLESAIEAEQSFVSVNTESVAEEEVKYTLDDAGNILELSKRVVGGLGEAVGINFVAAADKATLIARLKEVDDQDYFEGGIELAIQKDGLSFKPIDISEFPAIEVDFEADLERANIALNS
ncbi:UTP--glucose-1-phosphate uridylyltransferase [soil metagenome]